MKKIFLILFCIAAIVHVVAIMLGNLMIQNISKPAIMLSLIAYYLTVETRSMTVIIAMILSLLGDILLIFPERFIGGLVAFLLSHVFYIFSYRQHQGELREQALQGIHRIRLAFPIVLAGTGLVVVLYPVLGDLKLPVIVYAVVLVTMVLHALFRYGRTNSSSFWMVFWGAILFMLSDSILAINKFLGSVNYAGLWIMITYITAQYLIVRGLVKHEQ